MKKLFSLFTVLILSVCLLSSCSPALPSETAGNSSVSFPSVFFERTNWKKIDLKQAAKENGFREIRKNSDNSLSFVLNESGTVHFVQPNMQTDSISVKNVPAKEKTAVIFGDSMFNNPSIGYEFGDWLAEQNRYFTIFNYAVRGSGFGNTYEIPNGRSLYELLSSREDVRAAVAMADDIYIHLGGNDIFTKLYEGAPDNQVMQETELVQKVLYCFDTIGKINPNAIIYYVPSMDPASFMQDSARMLAENVPAENILNAASTLNEIEVAIAASGANILVCDVCSTDFLYHSPDNVHPTKECANMLFEAILRSSCRPKYVKTCILGITSAQQFQEQDLDALAYAGKNQLFSPESTLWILEASGTEINASKYDLKANSDGSYSADILLNSESGASETSKISIGENGVSIK